MQMQAHRSDRRFDLVSPNRVIPVSYTHLDVYKRQDLDRCADDITYIQNGNVLKSADKDTFLRSFDHLRTSEDKQPLTLEEIMLRTERSDFDETAL